MGTHLTCKLCNGLGRRIHLRASSLLGSFHSLSESADVVLVLNLDFFTVSAPSQVIVDPLKSIPNPGIADLEGVLLPQVKLQQFETILVDPESVSIGFNDLEPLVELEVVIFSHGSMLGGVLNGHHGCRSWLC